MMSIDTINQMIRERLDRDGQQAILIGLHRFQRSELRHHAIGCHCSEYCKIKNQYVAKKQLLAKAGRDWRFRNFDYDVQSLRDEVMQLRDEVKQLRQRARRILDEMYQIKPVFVTTTKKEMS